MADRRNRKDERRADASAELIGVVVLIGMLVMAVGLIASQVVSTPPPLKVPAASLRITNVSDHVLVEHLGGDALPLGDLGVRIVYRNGGTPTDRSATEFRDRADIVPFAPDPIGFFRNGDVFRANRSGSEEIAGAALIWAGSGTTAILSAFGDGLGPLTQAPFDPDHTPGPVYTVRTQPPVPTPTTNWSSNWTFIANFTPEESAIPTSTSIVFTDHSYGYNNTTVGGQSYSTPILVDDWTWTFGDGRSWSYGRDEAQAGASPNATYGVPGNYTVTLHVVNRSYGLSAMTAGTVSVTSTAPAVTFSAEPLCGYEPFTYNITAVAGFPPTVWYWHFPDGGTQMMQGDGKATTAGITRTFTSHLPGTLTLDISSPYVNGGENVTTPPFSIAPPEARAYFTTNVTNPATNITEGQAPLAVAFTEQSTGHVASRLWDFGDGGESTDADPVHLYTVPGTYNVNLTVRSVSCWPETRSVFNRTITVTPPLIANFTAENETDGNVTTVVDRLVNFTDTSIGGPTTWAWEFGDGGTSVTQNASHAYAAAGDYSVNLTVTNGTAHDYEFKHWYVHVLPKMVANFTSEPREGLQPLAVQFGDTTIGEPTAWLWVFGDGTPNSTEQHPAHIYGTEGNYTVTLHASNALNGDDEVKVEYIRVHPEVQANFTITSNPSMVGDTVLFNDTSTGGPVTSWTWSISGSASAPNFPTSGRNISYAFMTSGSYNVTLTVSNSWDTDAITKALTVDQPPTTIPTTAPTTVPTTLAPGAISGVKWNDLDRDGTKDAGEPGIANWTINLYLQGEVDPLMTTTTNATGCYAFSGLSSNGYEVGEVVPAGKGWTRSYPSGGRHSVLVTSGAQYFTDVDFGNYLGDVILSANPKLSQLVPGTYLQFRALGSGCQISIGGRPHNPAANQVVRLVIGSDGIGAIYGTTSTLNSFTFDNVTLFINDVLIDQGTVTTFWIPSYDSYTSTLRLVMPSQSGSTEFRVSPDAIINGNSAQAVTLFGLRPTASAPMNLANGGTYYAGGIENYTLPV